MLIDTRNGNYLYHEIVSLKVKQGQVEALLERLMDASGPTIISAYEAKIEKLEREKHKIREQIGKIAPSKDRFDEMLELSLKFLSSPWKLWASGNITLQRTVLKLAFAQPIAYHRKEGYRTPKPLYLSRC